MHIRVLGVKIYTAACACFSVHSGIHFFIGASGFTLFTDSEGGSHMTRGSMLMREPIPASWTRTYSGIRMPISRALAL